MTNAAQNLAPEAHPLRAAVQAARTAFQNAEMALEDLPEADEGGPLQAEAEERLDAADTILDAAREALVGSNCPRDWELREGGYLYDTVTASSPEEALEIARSNVDRGNYSESEGTLWIDVRVDCDETGEDASSTVTLDEREPDCESDEGAHDWQSPYALLGGLEENPGVWGNGGGVIIKEVCVRCGCQRTTDTWAQNPETGEQGLTSVSYEEEAFTAEELAKATE